MDVNVCEKRTIPGNTLCVAVQQINMVRKMSFFMNVLESLLVGRESACLSAFKEMYANGQYDRAARMVMFSLQMCVDLATEEVVHFLTLNGRDEILSALCYTLNQNGMDLSLLFNGEDFPEACKRLSYPLIALYSRCPGVEIVPLSAVPEDQQMSTIFSLIGRDDPDLLLGCLNLIPQLTTLESDRMAVIKLILENSEDVPFLMDQLWVVIKHFRLSMSDLNSLVLFWMRIKPETKLPKVLNMVYQMSVEKRTAAVMKARFDETRGPIGSTFVTDVDCRDAKANMSGATAFLKWMKANMANPAEYVLSVDVAAHSPLILVQVPMLLLTDSRMMLTRNLSFKGALIGEEAEGQGPVQDMFNFYFQHISTTRYFDADDKTTLLLPTSGIGKSDAELKEIRTVFYGLGVVFLKILIDRRNFGANYDSRREATQQRIKPLPFDLHPWIFRALLWKREADTRTLFHECLLSNIGLNKALWREPKSFNKERYIDKAIARIMNAGHREMFYQALRDGFTLTFVEGLTPAKAKVPMTKSREELKHFFAKVQEVSPATLQLLLVGTPVINAEALLDKFDFGLYKFVAPSMEYEDVPIDMRSEEGMLYLPQFQQAKRVFKRVITEWCNEPGQEKIRTFLNYIVGTPTMSPLQNMKWRICFQVGLENLVLAVWACDGTIRSALFRDAEHFKTIVANTLHNFYSDPLNRDISDVVDYRYF